MQKTSPRKSGSTRSPAKNNSTKSPPLAGSEEQLTRVRRICHALPGTTEKPSHGAPTFFREQRVYATFADNVHHDGHLAVWALADREVQEDLVRSEPEKYFRPPYVGIRGWIGIELRRVGEDELGLHLHEAWKMLAAKKR